MDELTYEVLKECYSLISSQATVSLALVIIDVFLFIWVLILVTKIIKERRVFKEREESLIKQVFEASRKNGGKNGK